MNRRVIVTGGAGFIGSHLVDFLIEKGFRVFIFDNLSTGKSIYLNKKADFIKIDITDLKNICLLVGKIKPFCVHHLAALPRIMRSVKDPVGTHQTNVFGTFCMLEAACRAKVSKFVFSSSSSVYGFQRKIKMNEKMKPNPISNYALQKLMAEMYCAFYARKFGMEVASLRYFNVYGPRQPDEGEYALVIGKFINLLKKGKLLTVYGDGEQTRDFTFVGDVIRANFLAMKTPLAKGKNIILNVGSGQEVSINALVKIIGGKPTYIKPNPRGEEEEKRKCADISLIKSTLSWKPEVNIEKGIKILLSSG